MFPRLLWRRLPCLRDSGPVIQSVDDEGRVEKDIHGWVSMRRSSSPIRASSSLRRSTGVVTPVPKAVSFALPDPNFGVDHGVSPGWPMSLQQHNCHTLSFRESGRMKAASDGDRLAGRGKTSLGELLRCRMGYFSDCKNESGGDNPQMEGWPRGLCKETDTLYSRRSLVKGGALGVLRRVESVRIPRDFQALARAAKGSTVTVSPRG